MKWWQLKKRDAELDRELQSDLELEADDLLRLQTYACEEVARLNLYTGQRYSIVRG